MIAKSESTCRPAASWPSTQVALLERVGRTDDQRSWAQLVACYRPLIYSYCRRRGLQDADAQDVVQNVLCRVQRAIPKFRYERRQGRFRSWLGTITLREIRRHLRRCERAQGLHAIRPPASAFVGSDQGEQASWTDQYNAFVLELALQSVRREFDRQTWLVFDRVWLRDQLPSAVARELDLNPAWVYKAKFRVLTRLKTEVARLAEDAAILQR